MKDKGKNVEKVKCPPTDKNNNVAKNDKSIAIDWFSRNLVAFVKTTCEIGVENLVKEFKDIQLHEKSHIKSHKAFLDNINKCRYKDILCYDEYRFILKTEEADQSDFIHANYMGPSKCSPFIATQGPLPDTINDFWRMIWQSKAHSIVMLCEIMENGKKKCEQYWPTTPNDEMKLDSIVIKFIDKQNVEKNIVRSTLSLTKKGKKVRKIYHYQYFEWPDRGVPTNYNACIRLMKRATKNLPTIVHCSAGIGRTGTVVCLDEIIKKMSTPEGCLFLRNVIQKKRQFRYGTVQTEVSFHESKYLLFFLLDTIFVYP